MEDKRLIEVCFPIKEVSKESVREKRRPRGKNSGISLWHISLIHPWWARRPLAACRAAIFASLVKDPKDEKKREELMKFIGELCKWENSLNQNVIKKAKKYIEENFSGSTIKLLDCFAGGGSIPLEALRLGCETYALEYNPVAVLILKATLEYPQKYGRAKRKSNKTLTGEEEYNPLAEDIKKWGKLILEEVEKEMRKFYPPDPDGSIPIGYIWARTIKCPFCGVEIPLIKQFWLAKKKNKKVAYKPIVNKEKKEIRFKIVEGDRIDFDPSNGFVKKSFVACPICESTISGRNLRKMAKSGKMSEKMLIVILRKRDGKRKYRIVNLDDKNVYSSTKRIFQKKVKQLENKWKIQPLLVEQLPPKGVLRVDNYGLDQWYKILNTRENLCLLSFLDKIKSLPISKESKIYLAFALNKLFLYINNLAVWRASDESIKRIFDRQRLQMTWDYVEANPFLLNFISDELYRTLNLLNKTNNKKIYIIQGSADKLPYPNNFFDIVVTDPPYYDNIPYSDSSDFFYVILKRSIGDVFSEYFTTPLTPKSKEMIAETTRHKSYKNAKKFFEKMIEKTFNEIKRVLKPEGIAVIVFAHKSTDAWESIINSLLNSGFYLTSSWPIKTEMKGRTIAQETASLLSSIWMVCRKRQLNQEIYFKDIEQELKEKIHERLEYFWRQEISGADFFISAIGPAVEVFGKYTKVKKLTGERMDVKEFLNYVRTEVSNYMLRKVLRDVKLGLIDPLTRFYIVWRWTYGNKKVLFDEARKLAQASGIEITNLWGNGLVKKEKEWISVLSLTERKDLKTIEKRAQKEKIPIIDALHYACVLWGENRKKELEEFLNITGYVQNETFWLTAQALSEILESGKEKRYIQGLLLSRKDLKFRKQPTIVDYTKGEFK